MSKTYTAATEEVNELLKKMMKKYHAELEQNGVRVGVIFANCEEGAAVKHGGYPAAAKISVVSLKDRVEKDYEAELLIDQRWWTESTRKHHEALLDHELTHLELVEDEEEGGFKRDDQDRPVLRIRLGDWNGGDGFKAIVERHGDFSVEIANLRKVEAKVAEVKTRLFPIDTPPEAVKPKKGKKGEEDTWQLRRLSEIDKHGLTPGVVAICGQQDVTTVGSLLKLIDGIEQGAPADAPVHYVRQRLRDRLNTTDKMADTLLTARVKLVEEFADQV